MNYNVDSSSNYLFDIEKATYILYTSSDNRLRAKFGVGFSTIRRYSFNDSQYHYANSTGVNGLWHIYDKDDKFVKAISDVSNVTDIAKVLYELDKGEVM